MAGFFLFEVLDSCSFHPDFAVLIIHHGTGVALYVLAILYRYPLHLYIAIVVLIEVDLIMRK